MRPPLLIVCALLLCSGCATWENFNPATQAVLKAGAKLAAELAAKQKELDLLK